MSLRGGLCLWLTIIAPLYAQTAAAPKPAPAATSPGLPVKRVALYKSGVGYFEHLGRVRNAEDVTISFTSGQLNDVLKSLTVLDLGGGRVTGVAYPSSTPVDRQLGELNLPLGDKATLTDFLGALRGARVEIRTGATPAVGRLLSVERKTRMGGSGATLEVDYLSMITETGEVKTIELTPGFSFRLLERNLTTKLDRYLDLVAATHEADVRKMVVSTAGTGERPVFVSYISEVPVWKATYRIVLDPKNDPLLQGWAIVDNTVGQDWDGVELSLVAGAPQSFIQELSKPQYSRRPVVPLPGLMSAAPQTHEARLQVGSARVMGRVTDPTGGPIPGAAVRAFDSSGAMVNYTTADSAGNYTLSGLPDGSIRLEFSSTGFNSVVVPPVVAASGNAVRQDVRLDVGSASQAVTVTAEAAQIQTSTAERAYSRSVGSGRALGLGVQNKMPPPPPPPAMAAPKVAGGAYAAAAAVTAAASAQELGDLFEYKLKEPITIRKNQSALVPIVHAKVNAEKVSLWNDGSGTPRPRRALWLTNSSGLTLDGGAFSVVEDETFAGEGIFDPIRPGEKRLISYAVDLSVTASSSRDYERQRITRARIHRRVLTHTREVRETKTYTFRNEDTKPRTVLIEHPVRNGWQLRSDAKPVETSAGWMRFRLPVEPKQTAVLKVEEAMPVDATYTISNIDSNQIGIFATEKSINPAIEEALRRVIAQKDVVNAIENRASALDDEKDRIYDDQQRVRENMKSLKGSTEERALIQRYTTQLNEQENRLQELTKLIKKTEEEKEAAEEALDKLIESLSFDVTL